MKFIKVNIMKFIKVNFMQLIIIFTETFTFYKFTNGYNYSEFFFIWTLISAFYILSQVKDSYNLRHYDIFSNFMGGFGGNEPHRYANLVSSFSNISNPISNTVKFVMEYGSRVLTISILLINLIIFVFFAQ